MPPMQCTPLKHCWNLVIAQQSPMRPVITYLYTCSFEVDTAFYTSGLRHGEYKHFGGTCNFILQGRMYILTHYQCTRYSITTDPQRIPSHFSYISKFPQRHSVEFPGCELCWGLRPHDDHLQKFLDSHRVLIPVAVEGSIIYSKALWNA